MEIKMPKNLQFFNFVIGGKLRLRGTLNHVIREKRRRGRKVKHVSFCKIKILHF